MAYIESLWQIPELPFLFAPLTVGHNPPGVPDTMPFDLCVEPETGRLCQRDGRELASVLASAYVEGSMVTGMMAPTGIGREYADDFLAVLERTLPDGVCGRRILEIGCGNGYLLERLADLGASVKGVEPGPEAAAHPRAKELGIERGFFPTAGSDEAVDVIVLYMVLEHVADPVSFLEQVRSTLRPGGTVVVAVQDEQPYIEDGELSLLFHEHYSYFTRTSLAATLASSGGGSVSIEASGFSNLLMAAWRPDQEDSPGQDPAPGLVAARRFRQRAENVADTIGCELRAATDAGRRVGVYVPARAVNALTLAGLSGEPLRFFDDNELLHGTYYPGFANPVESRAELLADPVDVLFVMSLSFGERIEASLRDASLSEDTQIIQLSQMLAVGAPC